MLLGRGQHQVPLVDGHASVDRVIATVALVGGDTRLEVVLEGWRGAHHPLDQPRPVLHDDVTREDAAWDEGEMGQRRSHPSLANVGLDGRGSCLDIVQQASVMEG